MKKYYYKLVDAFQGSRLYGWYLDLLYRIPWRGSCYPDITEAPMWVLIECIANKNNYAVIKSGRPVKKKRVEAMENIIREYFENRNDHEDALVEKLSEVMDFMDPRIMELIDLLNQQIDNPTFRRAALINKRLKTDFQMAGRDHMPGVKMAIAKVTHMAEGQNEISKRYAELKRCRGEGVYESTYFKASIDLINLFHLPGGPISHESTVYEYLDALRYLAASNYKARRI